MSYTPSIIDNISVIYLYWALGVLREMPASYYDILGVGRSASEKEIRQAYRRLARQFHPDVNAGDKTSEQKFKEVNEAYGVLSNTDSRKKYDEFGDNWKHADQMGRGRRGPGRGHLRVGLRWRATPRLRTVLLRGPAERAGLRPRCHRLPPAKAT